MHCNLIFYDTPVLMPLLAPHQRLCSRAETCPVLACGLIGLSRVSEHHSDGLILINFMAIRYDIHSKQCENFEIFERLCCSSQAGSVQLGTRTPSDIFLFRTTGGFLIVFCFFLFYNRVWCNIILWENLYVYTSVEIQRSVWSLQSALNLRGNDGPSSFSLRSLYPTVDCMAGMMMMMMITKSS